MIGINLFYFIVFRFRRQNLVRTLLILTISFDIYSSGSCFKILNNEALPGEGSHVALRNHLKRLVSVFINASRGCRKLNENSLSLSELWKRGIAMRCKELLQFCNVTYRRRILMLTSPCKINTIHRRVYRSSLTSLVASVSVWFRSRERPRNGILGLGRARKETSFFAPKPRGNACYTGYSLTRQVLWSARKITENYFFLAYWL